MRQTHPKLTPWQKRGPAHATSPFRRPIRRDTWRKGCTVPVIYQRSLAGMRPAYLTWSCITTASLQRTAGTSYGWMPAPVLVRWLPTPTLRRAGGLVALTAPWITAARIAVLDAAIPFPSEGMPLFYVLPTRSPLSGSTKRHSVITSASAPALAEKPRVVSSISTGRRLHLYGRSLGHRPP